MDKIEKYINELLEKSTPDRPIWNIEKILQGKKSTWNYIDGCMIKAILEMYAITKDEKYFSFADHFIDCKVMEDGSIEGYSVEELKIDNVNAGKTLFELYDLTGKEKYRKAIDLVYSQIQKMPRTKEGNFWHKNIYPNQVWLDGLYMCQPFYMEYETRYHNKAGYNDIVNQLTEMRSGKDAIWYVMALIDVLDHMSIEIFEHYKSLQEIFKKTIKCIPLGGDAKMQKVCMGYAILKACNIGILNPEKYLETGRTLIDGAIDEPFDQKDDVSMGIMMMAYAQFIRVM